MDAICRRLIIVLCLCVMLPRPSQAQLAVADAPLLAAVGSLAATITTILNEVRSQAAALANWPAIIAQLQAIAQLMADIDALVTEIKRLDGGRDQLITSGTTLCTIDDALAWKTQALQWQNQGYRLVYHARMLMGRTINVLLSLQVVLQGIVGATSGAQSASALLSVIAANLQELQSLTGAFQSGTMGKDVIETVIGIQLICLHQGHLANWGTYSIGP